MKYERKKVLTKLKNRSLNVCNCMELKYILEVRKKNEKKLLNQKSTNVPQVPQEDSILLSDSPARNLVICYFFLSYIIE